MEPSDLQFFDLTVSVQTSPYTYIAKRKDNDDDYDKRQTNENKAGYTATLVACELAGAVLEKVTRASGQEPYAQKNAEKVIVAKALDGQRYPLPLG